MNVRLFIIFWSDFVNREKNMILLSSVYNTDNSLTQDILCSTFGRFLIKKKKEKFIHIQQLGLWKKCNWYHMTEINERKNIKDTLIETLWSWWFFTQEKITGKKTDFLWIFKWEMLTSFSQNNVTLHNFSVLIIIQVL